MTIRYIGQQLDISVIFGGNPLTAYNKTYADITEISMNFKKDLATDDDDAYLEKLQSLGEVSLDEPTHTFSMSLADYGTLIKGTYHLVIGIKVNGIDDMIELEIYDDVVMIITDKQRS